MDTYVAFHEAGHAVMATLQYLPIHEVTIDPHGDSLGHAARDMFYMMENDAIDSGIEDWEQLRVEANARVALAGEIAQRIHDPDSEDPEHAAMDQHHFYDLLIRLISNEDERAARARLLRLQTEHLLRAHWDAVARVASLLLVHTTIDANAVKRAVWPL